jgi:hypothetical protein
MRISNNFVKVALRRQQAQEETEARELSLLYGTSCETILALKRSIQVSNDSQDEENDNDDGNQTKSSVVNTSSMF